MAAVLLPLPAAGADTLDEPEHLPWTDSLPPLPSQYQETEETLCVDGHDRCIDLTIRRMQARLQQLAPHCDHNAVFALYYLRTTEEFRRAAGEGLFDDRAFMNHWATVFADYYFRAYDGWYEWSQREHVPPAWRIAFRAADERQVSGTGNLLLGINAHVNRDLPFVLANIGQRAPDGTSRKPDHDRVNQFLRRVVEPARAEAAARFDPTMDDGTIDMTSLDDTTLFQVVVTWRERAWRNAELLAGTATLLERVLVAETIEKQAAAEAELIREGTAYRGDDSSARDAFCDENWRG